MYQRILVPITQSRKSEQALEPAITFASRFEAKVFLFQMVQIPLNAGGDMLLETTVEHAKKRGREQLHKLKERFQDHGCEIEVQVEIGYSPAGKIQDFIETHDIDLVIMASHARSGVSRFFLGSTTEQVLRHSVGTPVMVVPHDKEAQEE